MFHSNDLFFFVVDFFTMNNKIRINFANAYRQFNSELNWLQIHMNVHSQSNVSMLINFQKEIKFLMN